MITDEDTTKIVNKIIEANKELFYSKPEMDDKFDGLRKDFSNLQTAVTSFAKAPRTTMTRLGLSITELQIRRTG